MARTLVSVLCAALLLAACTYPRLVSIEPVRPAPNSRSPDVDAALARAALLQSEYSDGYRHSAQLRDLSQIPIIAAAAAAAWIVLDNGANAARDVGRIGIVAGAYSQSRDQLTATGMTEAYIAGHAALTCVLAQGSFFSGEQAQQRHSDLREAMDTLEGAIADLDEAILFQPASGTPAEMESLRTVRTSAQQAIAQARTAMDAARTENMAYQGAGSVFWQAVASISTRVASRGRLRPDVDYQALVDRFSPAESGGSAQGNMRRSATSIMDDLGNRMRALVLATGALRNATPNYSARLERVEACAAQAG